VTVPMKGRVDEALRKQLSDSAKGVSYMFWRAGVIANHFFVWCWHHSLWPGLDAPKNADGKKTKATKSHVQTLFRNMIKLGTYTKKPRSQQSNWRKLSRFWEEEGAARAPEPMLGVGPAQALDLAADKLMDNTLTELYRGFFQKQEKTFRAEHGDDGESQRERANGVQRGMRYDEKPTHAGGAELPADRKVTEQFMQRNLDAAVFATAELTERYEAVHGRGTGFSLAPVPRLNRKRMPFDTRALLDLAKKAKLVNPAKRKRDQNDTASLEKVLLKRKGDRNGRERGTGNMKVFDGFIDCDGVTMCVHYTHRKKATTGNDNCSEELLPASSLPEAGVDVDSDDVEVGGIDPGRKKIVTYWSPTVGSRALTREEYNKRSGAAMEKEESDKRTKKLQKNEHERLRANPGKTASLDGIRGFVEAQAGTARARSAVATQGDRELHLKFRTEKGKTQVVDRFFQGIKDKCGNKQVVVMYGDADFNATGRGESGGVPTKSIKRACKRHFLTRRASEFRTSRSCVFCKKSDVTDTQNDRVFCKHCVESNGEQRSLNKDVLGAINIRRSGIAESKGRTRPIDLRLRPSKRPDLRTAPTAEDCRASMVPDSGRPADHYSDGGC